MTTSNFIDTKTLNEIMTAGIEGGCAYWMNDDEVCQDIDVERDADLNITKITCKTDVDGKGWTEHAITHTQIRKALNGIKDDQKLSAHLRKFASKMLFDKDYDYDAGDADNIIQYAMFQDIVFG